MTENHQNYCDGRHNPADLTCDQRQRISDGNRHNPWKCFSPENTGGFHRFTMPLRDASCDYHGCPRLRSEMAAYWGVS